MSHLLPSTPPVDTTGRESRIVRLEDDDAPFQVLASSTARDILLALYDEPAPASVVADQIDSSIQNVQYHLDRLKAADLVEVVDTWYSSKGIEMDVLAPANEPLVITAGDAEMVVAGTVPNVR